MRKVTPGPILSAIKLRSVSFRKVLPLFYFSILIIGVLLTFVYAFVPKFIACSSLFGEEFCTPFGIYLIMVASLPGYLIAGNLLFFVRDLPATLSFLLIIVVSAGFYFILGLSLEKARGISLNSENLSKIIVVVFFIILLTLVLLLL